jgi:hypothetical protein
VGADAARDPAPRAGRFLSAKDLSAGDVLLGRACLDWSERRPHIGGELGRALADRMLALRWLARIPQTRALRVTDKGRRKLASVFGLRWD